MKQLLERWSQLEPKLCGKDWKGGYCIKFDNDMIAINPEKEDGLSKIQWTVQQAIIEKGWYLEIMLFSDNAGSFIKVGKGGEYNQGIRFPHSNLAEALLTTYLKVLDA